MKNTHLIPTEKPSRLWTNNLRRRLELDEFPSQHQTNIAKHIYITTKEDIKKDDWCLYNKNHDSRNPIWELIKCGVIEREEMYSISDGRLILWMEKIAITTDQDLINDGVQAIDDVFLEWFVKNPSCELVEVAELRKQGNPSTHDSYQIIIPKEETKQIDEKGNPLTYWGGLEEPKQETIEEAAYKNDKYLLGQVKEPSFCYNVFSFKEGAKWQQERSYSEEDVFKLLCAFNYDLQIDEVKDVTEWFEQFKKK